MNARILAKYRELRLDHIALYTGTGYRYHHKVTAIRALESARYHVDVTTRWEQAESEGLVRLQIEPDYDADLANLEGDCYDPGVNPDIQPHILARQRKEFFESVDREGVWGIIGQYRCPCCGNWQDAGSCWGFVGHEWSGYDLDIMAATLERVES